MQVSESTLYISRQIQRYVKYVTYCRDYHCVDDCRLCQQFWIGFRWWSSRLTQVGYSLADEKELSTCR